MKILSTIIIALAMISMVAMPLVMAQQQGVESQVQNQAMTQVQAGNFVSSAGEQMQIRSDMGEQIRFQVGNVEAKTNMVMTQEQIQDRVKLQVKLSNGRNAEIKIMPNVASETALARLRAKCGENCTIELKEVGTGNQVKVAYEIKTQKESKVFGLFRAKMQVQAQVDAENGEILQVKKPWWAFLATETE